MLGYFKEKKEKKFSSQNHDFFFKISNKNNNNNFFCKQTKIIEFKQSDKHQFVIDKLLWFKFFKKSLCLSEKFENSHTQKEKISPKKKKKKKRKKFDTRR